MSLSSVTVTLLATLAIQGTAYGQPAAAAGEPISIMGCLIRADEGGFLVAELPRPIERTDRPVGTSGHSTNLYWVDDDAMELFDHVGHRVQMIGRAAQPVDPDAIDIVPMQPWTEISFRADGKQVKVRLPRLRQAPLAAGEIADAPLNVAIRKFQRDNMRLAGLSCGS